MGEGEVHFVAAALEGFGVAFDFVVPAGVDVVDAGIDASADDFGSFLVVAAGVSAETDGRDHECGLALSAVFHVGVVVEDFGGIDGCGGSAVGAGGHDACEADGEAGGGNIADEITSGDLVVVHGFCVLIQTLKQNPGMNPWAWNESRSLFIGGWIGEWAGGFEFEEGDDFLVQERAGVDAEVVEEALVSGADADVLFVAGVDGPEVEEADVVDFGDFAVEVEFDVIVEVWG